MLAMGCHQSEEGTKLSGRSPHGTSSCSSCGGRGLAGRDFLQGTPTGPLPFVSCYLQLQDNLQE